MKVNEIITSLKTLLKENLNDTNLDFITKVDKELDNITAEHKKVEEDLVATKDKLIDIVKTTSFKADSEPTIEPTDTDKAVSIDEALKIAINEELNKK